MRWKEKGDTQQTLCFLDQNIALFFCISKNIVFATLYFVEELTEAAVGVDAIKSSEFTTTQPNCPLKARGSQKDGK